MLVAMSPSKAEKEVSMSLERSLVAAASRSKAGWKSVGMWIAVGAAKFRGTDLLDRSIQSRLLGG